MKCSKLLVLTVAILAMLMLFSACGSQATSVKSVLNTRKEFTDTTPTYTKGEKISDLSGASSNGYDHPLVYFTKQDAEDATKIKHMVYNVDTNSIVWSETASDTLKIAISINNIYLEEFDETVGYFTVFIEKTSKDKPDAKPEITTTLYSQTAEKVASASYKISAQDAADLLLFDEKCYRVAADGSITYAFVYPSLADFPYVETKYKDLYYEFGDNITVYNETLEIVSRYMLPTYTEDYVYVILKNGNVFLQYTYAADEHATDYTILEDGEKIMIASEIVNAKNGTAKKVKTDYIVDYAINLTQMGITDFNTKKLAVAAYVYRIVDQRIATDECFASIDKNGKISEISWSNNEQILDLYRHSEKRWIVETYDHSYLIDNKGKTIGDVSNASSFGKYFYANGRIYDDSLTMVYDFRSNDLSVKATVGDSLLLEDQDGALLLYTGGSEPTTLIPKDSNKTYIISSSYWSDNGFIIVQNDKLCEIYNDQGTLLCSVNDIDMERLALDLYNTIVSGTDSALLLKLTTTSGETVYVRLG